MGKNQKKSHELPSFVTNYLVTDNFKTLRELQQLFEDSKEKQTDIAALEQSRESQQQSSQLELAGEQSPELQQRASQQPLMKDEGLQDQQQSSSELQQSQQSSLAQLYGLYLFYRADHQDPRDKRPIERKLCSLLGLYSFWPSGYLQMRIKYILKKHCGIHAFNRLSEIADASLLAYTNGLLPEAGIGDEGGGKDNQDDQNKRQEYQKLLSQYCDPQWNGELAFASENQEEEGGGAQEIESSPDAEEESDYKPKEYYYTGEYKKIRHTMHWFSTHPFLLALQYRAAKLAEFFGYKHSSMDTKLYPLLRTFRNLGGKGYIGTLYETHFNEQNPDDPKAKIDALYQKFKHGFNTIYKDQQDQPEQQPAGQDQQEGEKLAYINRLDRNNAKDEKTRALLLRLMPDLKAHLNRFARKHHIDQVIVFDKGNDLSVNQRKKMLDDNELPGFTWTSAIKPNIEQQNRRDAKFFFGPIGKFIALFVALGQAVIGAYSVYEFASGLAMLTGTLWAPGLAAVALVASLVTNYILFRNRTINTMVQLLYDGKFFGDFTHPVAKGLAGLGFIMALSAGFIMGAISWIGCTHLLPGVPNVAMGLGISLMVMNLVSYTSLMYVSTINLLKRIEHKLNAQYWLGEAGQNACTTDGVLIKLKKQWLAAPVATTCNWLLHFVCYAGGAAILLFSLTALLGSWHSHTIEFLTETLPAFMQVAPEIANIISITVVLGFAAAVRFAFNFESIFTLVDTVVDKIIDGVSSLVDAPSNQPGDQERFEMSDLWKDPLNTTLKWAENGVKVVLVVINSVAFACLAMFGFERLAILGIDNEGVAKGLSLLSTGLPSAGANSGAMMRAQEANPGKVFDSPVTPPSGERTFMQSNEEGPSQGDSPPPPEQTFELK